MANVKKTFEKKAKIMASNDKTPEVCIEAKIHHHGRQTSLPTSVTNHVHFQNDPMTMRPSQASSSRNNHKVSDHHQPLSKYSVYSVVEICLKMSINSGNRLRACLYSFCKEIRGKNER